MPHFLQYWKNYDSAAELGTPLRFSASNQFPKRKVSKGDSLWLVAIIDGRLILLGHFKIDRLISQTEATRLLGPSIYSASTYALPESGQKQPIVEIDIQVQAAQLWQFSGTRMRLD
jgi:hypothetical protein